MIPNLQAAATDAAKSSVLVRAIFMFFNFFIFMVYWKRERVHFYFQISIKIINNFTIKIPDNKFNLNVIHI